MNWIDEQEKMIQEDKGKDYFKMQEGDNRIVLLSHCAQYLVKWTGTTYAPAEKNDEGISAKGVCWVLHDGRIKLAQLPYTIVKAIRELMKDEDYAFEEFPMNRGLNLKAVGAGTKEVEYTVIPSPKEYQVPTDVLAELEKKPSPEEMVEKMRSKAPPTVKETHQEPDVEYDPDKIPF